MTSSRFGRIGVLAGGPSNEREISLRSGRAVCEALSKEGCDAIFLDVRESVCDIIERSQIDIAFIALHGRFGEDGTVQKILEDAGIPYTGSGVKASRTALDKVASKEVFLKKGIPTPQYAVMSKGKSRAGTVRLPGFPVVVKPRFEGSSIGLSIVREEASLSEALARAFEYGENAVVEEYIDGRELTVGILDDRPLPVIEVVPKNRVYDYSAKYKDPETLYKVPAPVGKSVYGRAQELGEAAHRALGCRCFSRVDMMADRGGELFVLEVNTIPGMTERSLLPKAAMTSGLEFGKLCIRLVEDALKRRKRS
ncbi:MAG: D-alanine--D-alanine ligase [Candidatus Omnitrophota bacterium]